MMSCVATMSKRIGLKDKILFAGGASFNKCLVRLLGGKLGTELVVPDAPQLVGALGAALMAKGEITNGLR